MFLLVLFAFLAGVVTILSPCILPLLPIILSSSAKAGKRRPFGIMVGFILSFSFFTLFLTSIVSATNLSADSLRVVAVIILLIFGIGMLVPQFQLALEKLFSKLHVGGSKSDTSTGFWGGVVFGMSLGLIWTPCVGPIMASVLTLAATSSVSLAAVFITVAYSLGTAIPMVAIIYGGRTLLNKVPFLLKNSGKIQKFFGVVIILLALAIHFRLDTKFQQFILETFPNYGTGLTSLEDNEVVKNALEEVHMNDSEEKVTTDNDVNSQCKTPFYEAPELIGGGEWINSAPLKLEDLKGKVVLVDFWTYTCINCIRTLPYLNAWNEQYADDGLVIVGVHTPEFEFEKDYDNVKKATEDLDVEYPVVQDNDYKIWRAYENRYWPAKYFVDKNGCVRDEHFGEGDYEESEEFIRGLLAETGINVEEEDMVNVDAEGPGRQKRTPETYLGYARMMNFVSPEGATRDQFAEYSVPEELGLNKFAFGGSWNVGSERTVSKAGATLEFDFQAKNVFLVMRGPEGARVRVSLDGEIIAPVSAGSDVLGDTVVIDKDRLYELVHMEDTQNRRLKLEFLDDDIEIFAFTFG